MDIINKNHQLEKINKILKVLKNMLDRFVSINYNDFSGIAIVRPQHSGLNRMLMIADRHQKIYYQNH